VLNHNPIINPVNNYEYNRYINFGQNITNNKNNIMNQIPQNIISTPIHSNNGFNLPNPSQQSSLFNTNSNYSQYKPINNGGIVENNSLPSLNDNFHNHTNPYNFNSNIESGNYNYQYNTGNSINNPVYTSTINQPQINSNNNLNVRTPFSGDRLRMAATNIIG
jgi:hypothetical protein